MDEPTRAENTLGEALRAWRGRLTAADVGLPATRRRRTAGLRREELAALAGVSVDYLLRLEQGRSRRPSREVLAALARALRLSPDEACRLHLVAGLLPPVPGQVPDQVPASVARLVRHLGDIPAGVFAADWTLLAWNPSWAALLADPDQHPLAPRNLVRALFVDPPAPGGTAVLPTGDGDPDFTTALVAELRLTLAAYPDDRELAGLVAQATAASAHFRALWKSPSLGARMGGRRSAAHPSAGRRVFHYDVLKLPENDVRIMTCTPARDSGGAHPPLAPLHHA
ncbi:helix-turn-helix domain-containing protein [Actinacidiphila sp. bgisy144]|uniref:MmyB family transcriptional regulator n=1 Tax=Actinacidiphila sp. bgisy144 TaxID=3413791 RepID=UPI003EB71C67